MSERHTTPRFEIRIKKYTHEILKNQAQSRKLAMKIILAISIDLLPEYKLLSEQGRFLLSRREAVFEEERASSPLEGWNSVYVGEHDTVKILQAFADKSGLPRHQIVDHLIRLVRDLKMLSADKKGKVRLRKAIENRSEPVQIETGEFDLPENREGELYPTHTHTFSCTEGEITAGERWFKCPKDGSNQTLEEGCIQFCDHLLIKVKLGFRIPEGYFLSLGLQERLGHGRSQHTIGQEALDKGETIYFQSIGEPLD